MRSILFIIILLNTSICFSQDGISIVEEAEKGTFPLIRNHTPARLVFDPNGAEVVETAVEIFSSDLKLVSGESPNLYYDYNTGPAVFIGTIGESQFIEELVATEKLEVSDIKGKWETFKISVIRNPFPNVEIGLVIAGSDARGTAFGVLELSKSIGVNPYSWWADVPVKKQSEIHISGNYISKPPSVKFRGIFLNDEDWGLQPWAEKTYEPEVGDIGPKTYAKIFELLLRLKANTIWPAMHPSTKAFFHYPGNPKMAKKYHIVVGTSHAEPMLRNNVDEWDKDNMGSFNYLSNKESVYKYWEERVKEAKDLDAIYTLGMRGIHDSGMEGVEGIEEATANLQNVLKDQRELLETYNNKEVTEVPQAFTVYKEVLDVYDHGLQLPEDVTIVWTDDNYGYIRRLGNKEERARKGGGGIYYHASYWGRPHDYQWLSTTHPGLIREEMMKAYKTNSRRMWILNVGDLKPAEYNMQFFMDMAYDAEKFQDPEYVDEHMEAFYNTAFGEEDGKEIADLKMEYYNLAFKRKPEFMGWSQTEPTTQIDTTSFDPFSWGDEVNSRINYYTKLEKKVEKIKENLDTTSQDAFFQLVYYPVKGAAFMNKKFLYRDLAIKYASEQRLISQKYKELSHGYYDSISAITRQYNSEISEGKWEHIMDMAPRRLPVFDKPEISINLGGEASEVAGISVENNSDIKNLVLPTFYKDSDKTHFLDVFLKQIGELDWSLKEFPGYIIPSETEGQLNKETLQQRILVKVDWGKWEEGGEPQTAAFIVKLGEKEYPIQIKTRSYQFAKSEDNVFTEQNGIVVMYAENYSDKKDHAKYKWQKLSGLGYSENLMKAAPVTEEPLDTLEIENNSPYLEYTIHTKSITDSGELILNALPTHPLTNEHSLRVGVQWNNGEVEIIDFRTFGRSEEWKQNVLRNLARKTVPVEVSQQGEQNIKIYMIDEGVYLDFIYLKLKNQLIIPYGLLQETRTNKIN
mgnify:CR=1 FL=1